MKLRHKLILDQLISENSISIEYLSGYFGVTARTIRNDIDEINLVLKENGHESFLQVKKNQLSLNATVVSIGDLRSLINLSDYYSYRLSSDERQNLIAIELLVRDGEVLIDDLSDLFYVSRSTIISDLTVLRKMFIEDGISIDGKRGQGISVDCSETIRRAAIRKFLTDKRGNVDYQSFIDAPALKAIFDGIDIERVSKIVIDCERKFDYRMTDTSFEGLVIHIALSIKRNESGFIDQQIFSRTCDLNQTEYEIACEIYERLNKELNLSLSENERQYIAQHIFNKSGSIKTQSDDEDWLYIQYLVTDLIQNVQKNYQVNLIEDKHLFDGLMTHITSALYRLKNKNLLQNPLKSDLKNNYKYLFNLVAANLMKIDNYIGNDMSEDEIAYIVIHFASALEKYHLSQNSDVPNILIVCSTGLATAQLMHNKLQNLMNVNIVGNIPVHLANDSISTTNVDLIVSSVKLDGNIPSVTVSPLIRVDDIELINSRLIELGFRDTRIKKPISQSVKIRELIDIVKENAQILDEHKLVEGLKTALEGNLCSDFILESREDKKFMLSELLTNNSILLHQVVEDWESAVRKAGTLLVNNNSIHESYIDSAIRNVKELGPYIVITKGVAIPHAPTEDGVMKTGISLLTLDKGVNFGNELNDPVKYIFMLCTINPTAHLKALTDLVEILSLEEFYGVLDSSSTPEQVTRYILEFEKNKKGGYEND